MEMIVWPDLVGPWPLSDPEGEVIPRSAWPQGLAPGGAVQSENDPPREAPEAERDQHHRRPTVE